MFLKKPKHPPNSWSAVRAVLLFILVLLVPMLAQAQVGKRVMRYGDTIRFISEQPVSMQNLKDMYKFWQQAIADKREPEKIDKMYGTFEKSILYHTGFFAHVADSLADDLSIFREQLEYFDQKSLQLIDWYLSYVQSEQWQEMFTMLSDAQRQQYFHNLRPEEVLELRSKQVDFYRILKNVVAQIPARFRRNRMDRFRLYDTPPIPGTGFHELQAAFSDRLSKLIVEVEGVILVKAFIATDGQVLRAQVQQPSGIAEIDSAALQTVQQANWQPAARQGKPYKTDVLVPLRIWD